MDNLILDNINSSINLEQSLLSIIQNILKEEAILSEILALQEKFLVDLKKLNFNVDDYIAINESINCTIKNIINLKMLIQFELDSMQKLIDKMTNLDVDEELEE